VSAALRYLAADDLGVVTSYFNPYAFRARKENFERFALPLREAGIPLVIVEACFDDQPATLPPHHATLRVPARDVMWQKERLLDLGTGWLPPRCTKVAWLDADVLFENDAWAVETSLRLDSSVVVQPFSHAVRLSRGTTTPQNADDHYESFASMVARAPEVLSHGKYDLHGHTGFAWAARRDVVARHGLYDAAIGGSADHLMAHAFVGDEESACVARMIGHGGPFRSHFRRWARRVREEVGGLVTFTPGRILHLWHGTLENRRYAQRNKELRALRFDPKEDIRISSHGCWEWASEKHELHAWARRYFLERKEDEEGSGGPA
jgi:hypothetical protein